MQVRGVELQLLNRTIDEIHFLVVLIRHVQSEVAAGMAVFLSYLSGPCRIHLRLATISVRGVIGEKAACSWHSGLCSMVNSKHYGQLCTCMLVQGHEIGAKLPVGHRRRQYEEDSTGVVAVTFSDTVFM